MPELIVSLKGRELRRYSISKAETTIGREKSSDVVIDNTGISRVHAVIRRDRDDYLALDPGSTNGLFVNGQATRAHRLVDGDVIHVGKFTLTFSSAGDEAPMEMTETRMVPLGDQLRFMGTTQKAPSVVPDADALRERVASLEQQLRWTSSALIAVLLVSLLGLAWLITRPHSLRRPETTTAISPSSN